MSERSSKRIYGTGSVETKNRTWYGRWRVDGRQLKRSLGPVKGSNGSGLTKKDAERELRKVILEYKPPRDGATITFAEAGTMHINKLRGLGRKKSTIEAYESTKRVHLDPEFGDRPIDVITPQDIERLQGKMLRKAKPKSVVNWIGNASAIFNYALKQGWIETNPCSLVDPPTVHKSSKLRYFTWQQLTDLLANVPDDYLGPMERTLYKFAAETGLRRGECLGLRWESVDYAAERIHVIDNYVLGEDGPPKSNKSRSVPLSKTAEADLKAHFERSEFTGPRDRVFAHPFLGKPFDASKLQKRLKAALKRGQIGEFRELVRKDGKVEMVPCLSFHCLRHTYGTMLAGSGRPPVTVQTYMGHASIRETEKYMHHAPIQDEAEQVDNAFRLLEAQAALEAAKSD